MTRHARHATSVLVVDDHEPIRRDLRIRLEEPGYCVTTASDGRDALAVFTRERPDLVLTDLRMPGMDGTALIAALKVESPDTPVVAMSGVGDLREALGAITAGAWEYLPKPVTAGDQLDLVIRRALDRARLISQNREYQASLESLVATRTREVEDRERTLRIVADNTWDWEWWREPGGRLMHCSPSCARITGHSPETFAADAGLMTRIIHADDRPRVLSYLDRAGSAVGEVIEYRIAHQVGGVRWVETACHAIRDESGALLGVRGSTRDSTDRKTMEAQLLRMQRQESLGRIANGIAHDLNNVLAPIMMAGDLLQDIPLKDNQRAYVEMIRQSAARGADMVKQLLLYSRGSDGRRATVKPAEVVRDAVRIVTDTFPKNIAIRLAVPADTWPIEADQTQLHQVVLNLCVNARDAMPEGGTLAVAVEQALLDNADVPPTAPNRGGPYIVLNVVDSGTGIAPGILDQIFDPFFTTKPHGHGTGLGLSTVQGIVAGHGGFIDVRSVCGRGTEIRVHLPAKPGSSPAVSVAPPQGPRGRGETVLVVDDEKPIRDMLQRTLHANGYRVLVADGGPQALEVYGHEHGVVDVVLLDAWMPYMDGPATIRLLAARDPGARVIAMSGLAESREESLAAGPVVKRFLEKPWQTHELLAAVREVLNPHVSGGST